MRKAFQLATAELEFCSKFDSSCWQSVNQFALWPKCAAAELKQMLANIHNVGTGTQVFRETKAEI